MSDDTINTGVTNEDVISVQLPANLIAQIDVQVGNAFVDRKEFIRTAVRHYLAYIRESQGTVPSDIG